MLVSGSVSSPHPLPKLPFLAPLPPRSLNTQTIQVWRSAPATPKVLNSPWELCSNAGTVSVHMASAYRDQAGGLVGPLSRPHTRNCQLPALCLTVGFPPRPLSTSVGPLMGRILAWN